MCISAIISSLIFILIIDIIHKIESNKFYLQLNQISDNHKNPPNLRSNYKFKSGKNSYSVTLFKILGTKADIYK